MSLLLLNGRPAKITPAGGGGGSGGAAGFTGAPLTGISFSQAAPVNDLMNDQSAGWGGNFKTVVATYAPIGGVGPFQYQVLNADGTWTADGYVAFDTAYSIFANPAAQGWIGDKQQPGKPNTKLLRITDATGATASRTVTIDESLTTKQIWVSAEHRVIPRNANLTNLLNMGVVLWGGSAVDTSTAISVSDTGGYYSAGGGSPARVLFGKSFTPSDIPANGTYTVTVSASGYASKTITYSVVDAVLGTPYFLPATSVISTSMIAGSVLGSIACTTPNNNFTATVSDPSGVLAISGRTLQLLAPFPGVGAYTFSVTINDNGLTATQAFTINVVAGVTLSPSAMVISGLTTSFGNDTQNNVLGTIPTPSGITGTPSWSIVSQTGYNEAAVTGDYGIPARYQLDQAGRLTAPPLLSAGLAVLSGGNVTLPSATDTVVVSCTDGTNTCTRPIAVTVNWAAVAQDVYVSPSSSTAPAGTTWFATMGEAFNLAKSAHAGLIRITVEASADPDHYTNDNGASAYHLGGLWGPIHVRRAPSGPQPRIGGPSANNAGGGQSYYGHGFIVFGHGDAVIDGFETSGCHDDPTDGGHACDALRKDGNTYGNISVLRMHNHDNDNGFLTGILHGEVLIDSSIFASSGTSYSGSGAAHNIYIGDVGKLTVKNSVFRRSNSGHLFKCRAKVFDIHDNRFFDGLSGSSSACLDLPFGGSGAVYNNAFEKGAMALAAEVIRYGEEGLPYVDNTLSVHDNTISVLTLNGAHYSPVSVLWFQYALNRFGVGPTATLANNSMYLSAGTQVFKLDGSAPAPPSGAYSQTGTTTLTLPPALDTSRPDSAGTLPAAGPLYRHQSYGQDTFTNFNGVYQYQDRDQIRVAHTASAGTVLCNIWATNQMADQGRGTANPFGAGTAWSIVGGPTWDGVTVPWAAAGKYGVSTNADGSAVLKVGSAALTAGVDTVQLRATAPNGTLCDSRYPVIVT